MAAEPSTSRDERADIGFIKSERGQELLLRHGYRYNKQRKNKNGVTVWRCVNRQRCKALLHTNNDLLLTKEEPHSCQPSVIENEMKYQLDKCIKRSEKELTTIPKIYGEMVSDLHNAGYDLIQKVPDFKNIKKRLYRHRNTSLQVKKLRFKKVTDLIIPPCYEDLKFADYGYKKTRITLFANQNVIKYIETAESVFCDGTFKSCVPPFLQVYTLHIDLGSTHEHTNILPAIYALLPDKQEKTYEIFFYLIKSRIPQFSPRIFTTDFEKSAMAAIGKIFPDARIQGCLFHFQKSLWRNAKKLGMDKSLIDKMHVKRCMALAYVPREYRSDGWLYIESENEPEKKITQFNDYFVRTWLDENAYFSNTWSFFDVCHKTNNAIESWNSRFNRLVKPKPNIAMFLDTLRKDSNYYLTLYNKNQYISVKSPERIKLQKRIEDIVSQLNRGEINIQLCIEKLRN